MEFRASFSSKKWPKIIKDIYFNRFLPDINSGRFSTSTDFFSNYEILDCLETERNSAFSLAKLIKNILNNRKIYSLIIIGAGSGRLGKEVTNLFPEIKIYQVDKNPFVIKRLKKKFKNQSNFKFILADANNLSSIDNNSVDVVFCYSLFRYLDNIRNPIYEFIRIVKNGGKIIICEAKKFFLVKKIREFLIKENINFKKGIIPNIKLPHLTFFYYLVYNYSRDKYLKKIVNNYKKKYNDTTINTIFRLAGDSLGSIYITIIEKLNN